MDQEQGAEREPSEFERFQQQLGQQLGQFAQGMDRRLGAIEQRVATPAAAPAAAPQIAVPADINDRLRERMIGDPLEFVKEVTAVATQRATAEAQKLLTAREQEQAAQAQATAFWQTFYSYPQNQDVGVFHDQLYAHFMRASHIQDPSQRADFAADQIRQALAAREQAAQQAAARQKQNVRGAAAAPGGQFMPAQAQGDYAPEEERRDPRAELHSAVDELAQQRQKRMWHNIDTADYRAASRERETKVRQDKYIGNKRRSA